MIEIVIGSCNKFTETIYIPIKEKILIYVFFIILIYEIQTNIKEIVFDIKKEKNPCPADGQTKRQSSKELIKSLNKQIPGFRDNLFKALTNSEQLFIWDKEKIINGDI